MCLIIQVLFARYTRAQQGNFIYGNVLLKNGESVRGIIRFSQKQVFWTDVVFAKKNTQSVVGYLDAQQRKSLEDHSDGKIDWAFLNLWRDKMPEKDVEGICRYGDIASIHITGARDFQLYLKNGYKMRASFPADMDMDAAYVEVFTSASRKILWKDISRFNFQSTPPVPWNRKPLYGTVYTNTGAFKGFISWGQSKFLVSQTLYGKNRNTMSGIKFADISRIDRQGSGAMIRFRSGKQVFLTENPDVNTSNPGIAITNIDGRVIVSWPAFKYVEFEELPNDDLNYRSFRDVARIYATVASREKLLYKGNCTFDLDEEWNFELLEGVQNGITYQLPFGSLQSVSPLDAESSRVMLKDGGTLTLRGRDDVDATNWGLFIWLKNSQRKYLPWKEISTIKFR